jgi:hypothetical protein
MRQPPEVPHRKPSREDLTTPQRWVQQLYLRSPLSSDCIISMTAAAAASTLPEGVFSSRMVSDLNQELRQLHIKSSRRSKMSKGVCKILTNLLGDHCFFSIQDGTAFTVSQKAHRAYVLCKPS